MRRTHQATRSRAGQLDRVTLELRGELASSLAPRSALADILLWRCPDQGGPAGPNRSSHQQPIRGRRRHPQPFIPVTNAIESMIASARSRRQRQALAGWADGAALGRRGDGGGSQAVSAGSTATCTWPPWTPPSPLSHQPRRMPPPDHPGRHQIPRRPAHPRVGDRAGRLRVGSAARSGSWHTARAPGRSRC